MVALDAVIHQPTRLQIMALLYRNRQASFTDLRDGLRLTPGNLASHAAKLEEAGYLKSGRILVDLSFEVHYRITDHGAEAFRAYLAGLQELLREAGAAPAIPEPRSGTERSSG
jgi:DNA-binding MarR family transcriptional regulator